MSKDIRRMERFLQRFKKWDKMGELEAKDVEELGKRDINEILSAIKSIVKVRLLPLSDRYDIKLQVVGKLLEIGVDAIFKLDFSDMTSTDEIDDSNEMELENKYRILLLLVNRLNKKLPERLDFVDSWFLSHGRELESLTLSFGIAVKTVQLTIHLLFHKK